MNIKPKWIGWIGPGGPRTAKLQDRKLKTIAFHRDAGPGGPRKEQLEERIWWISLAADKKIISQWVECDVCKTQWCGKETKSQKGW